MESIRLFGDICRLQIKSQLQYRANALAGFVNQFVVLFVEFIAMFALFDRFGQVGGWEFTEVLFIYGIINLAFAVSETLMRGFETNLANLIRRGEYDRYLLRPQSTILQVCANGFQFARLGRCLQALLVLIWAVYSNREAIGGKEWIALIICIAGCIFLYFSLYIMTGIISFKLLQHTEFMSIFIQGSVTTMQYPVTCFPKWLQFIFTYVLPVAAVSYYPVAAILNKPLEMEKTVAFMLPLLGVVLFVIAISVFRKVEKGYVSSGS